MKQSRKKNKRSKNNTESDLFEQPEQDDYFYFIAGYTPGGAPYGITWEEAREQGLTENDADDIDNLPFDSDIGRKNNPKEI